MKIKRGRFVWFFSWQGFLPSTFRCAHCWNFFWGPIGLEILRRDDIS